MFSADRVYQDVGGKKIIAGTFSGYKFSKRPPVAEIVRPDGTKQKVLMGGMQMGSPSAYVSLTDVCDGTTIQVQFVNLSKNITLFANNVAISSVDRLSNVELVLPLPLLPITEAGVYALQIVCEGEILGSWRVMAEDLDAKKEGTNAPALIEADYIQVVTTTERREDAERIARELVESRLAACVQIVGPITSTYRWQGKIEMAEEWQCWTKSRRDLYDAIEQAIRRLHPYEVPEILAVPVLAGSASIWRGWTRK